MKKNVLTTGVNESGQVGRNKKNNRSWGGVTNPGQELYKLGDQVTRLKEEIGNKNIELASLRVDVERGELQIKKRCDVLQVKGNSFDL